MKYGQKIIAGLLSAAMAWQAGTAGGLGVHAQQSELTEIVQCSPKAQYAAGSYETLVYHAYEDHVEIVECTDTAVTSVTIPSKIDGVPVTTIGSYAFNFCTKLTSVTIPDSVTSIGEYAFYECYDLTNVQIPEGVTHIEPGTFGICESLTEITIPDSVTSIGVSAFRYTALTSITIPDGVTEIGSQAFYNCDGLTKVIVPDSVTSYAEDAFAGCDNLTELVLPEHLTAAETTESSETAEPTETTTEPDYLGPEVSSEDVSSYLDYADYGDYIKITGCDTSVTSVTIPAKIDGVPVTRIADRAFSHCYDLTQVSIPASVTTIEQMAFYQCKSLKSVSIPDSVTYLGRYAFGYCKSLTQVKLSCNIRTMGEHVFTSCPALTEVLIPNGATVLGDGMFWGCDGLTRVTIPGSVTTIGDQTFRECSSLTEVHIPEGVEHIGSYVFYLCESLTEVTIPTTVTTFGTTPFYRSSGTLKVLVMKSDDPADAELLCITDFQCAVEIAALPDKTSYLIDEPLDLTGMQINVTRKTIYNDTITMVQTAENVEHSELTVTGFDSTAEGLKMITVDYPYYDYDTQTNASVTTTFTVIVTPSYQICYDANGGEGAPLPQVKVKGTELILTDSIPLRENYLFAGWSTTPDGAAEYSAGGAFALNADTTLYAVWEPLPIYTITYDANGGYGVPSAQTKQMGDTLTLATAVPSRTGYLFDGWAVTSDGAVQYNAGDLYENDADLTLYAVWAPAYYISYNVNGGTGAPETQTVRQEEYHPCLSDITPTREEYSFGGWALRPNGSSVYFSGDRYLGNVSVTLYAEWVKVCKTCKGLGEWYFDCSYCVNGGITTTTKSCTSCRGTGQYTQTVTEVQKEEIPCVFCVDGKYFSEAAQDFIKCPLCKGECSYIKETTVTYDKTYSCTNCGGDGEITETSSCSSCNGKGSVYETCRICGGSPTLSTTATLPEGEVHSYVLSAKQPQFYFSHDTTPLQKEALLESVTRYCFTGSGSNFVSGELLNDWSHFTLKGDTPAAQFSGQSGLQGILLQCTDEYGTITLTLPNAAYIGVKGDANMDGAADAADAAAILVYAAEHGAGKDSALFSETDGAMEDFSYFLADVNGESRDGGSDSPLDASDAACILVYAAAQGSGSAVTWDEVLGIS